MPGFARQLDTQLTEQMPFRLNRIIFVLLCSILVFSVVAFGAVDLWALGALSFFSGIIAILWLTDAWLKKEFHFSLNPLQIPLLGLIGIGIIQLLPLRRPEIPADLLSVPAVSTLSLAPYSTRLAIVQLVVYLMFFAALFVFINGHDRLRKIVLTVIIFGSLMAFYGTLQRFTNSEMIYGLRLPNQANPFGSFVNGHHFAALMEMTIGLTLGFLFSRTTEHVWRIFSGIAVFVMGIAIIFTSSRGGMLSLLAVIGFGVAANVLQKPAHQMDLPDKGEKNYRRIFLYLGGGLGVILTLIAAALLLSGDQFLLRGTGLTGQGDISNGRFHFWQIAWRIFLDYPLLGAGLESFAYAFPNYDTWNGFYRVEQAHNDYLQILAEAGILGFICVAAFIFLLFKQGLRIIRQSADSFRRDTAVGALAGCCGILVHSFFDFPLRTPANVFFFLTLAVLATVPLTTPKRLRKKRESYSFI